MSLDIGRGEFLTLLGPSGSGKTTLLMILAGFEQPTTGRILSAGEDITAKTAEARAFGMVFQGYALFPHMTVGAEHRLSAASAKDAARNRSPAASPRWSSASA